MASTQSAKHIPIGKVKGKDSYVVPNMIFDEAASTVSFQFDIEK